MMLEMVAPSSRIKRKNQAVSAVIALLTGFLVTPPVVQVANASGIIYNDGICQLAPNYEGTGAQGDPYLISDSHSLWEVTDCNLTTSGSATVFFSITNDINALEGTEGPVTLPIGYSEGFPSEVTAFSGSLDGNGHRISGLSMSAELNSNMRGLGLFAHLHNAIIEDLQLVGTMSASLDAINHPYNSGEQDFGVGTLAGYSTGRLTLSGVVNHATVSGPENVGGLVGSSRGSNHIQDTTNSGAVSGMNCVGGLIGVAVGAFNIERSSNLGVVSAAEGAVAGLVGFSVGRDANSRVANAVNHGTISGSFSGGLIGEFIGVDDFNSSSVSLSLESSQNFASVSGGRVVGGLVGTADFVQIRNSSNTGSISGSASVGGIFGGFLQFHGGWNGSVLFTGESPDTVPLQVDLESTHNSGSVTGVEAVGGLIGVASNSSILASSNSGPVSGTEAIGGLVGLLYGQASVSASSNISSISGVSGVGGLIGGSVRGPTSIHFSSNFGDVWSTDDLVGGLVGASFYGDLVSELHVVDSRNTGNVTGGYWAAGGLIGESMNQTFIQRSLNSGNVIGHDSGVGGLVGYIDESVLITQSHNLGAVEGTDYVGGLVGWGGFNTLASSSNQGPISGSSWVGGLIGSSFDAVSVRSSRNSGAVSATSGFAGGLVGLAETTADLHTSVNLGPVNSRDYVGGLIGRASMSAVINSYNLGSVSGSDRVGGIIGSAEEASIATSYNAGPVSGFTLTDGVVGDLGFNFNQINLFSTEDSTHVRRSLATSLRRAEGFGTTSLDFTNTWGFGSCSDNNGFPMLRVFADLQEYNSVGCGIIASTPQPPSQSAPAPVTSAPSPASAPATYNGPVFDRATDSGVIGTELILTGQRLGTITSLRIGDVTQVLTSVSATAIRFTVSASTSLGVNDIVVVSGFGALTLTSMVTVLAQAPVVEAVTTPPAQSPLIGKTRMLSRNTLVNRVWFEANLMDSGIKRLLCTAVVSQNATNHQRGLARKQASRTCSIAAEYLTGATTWVQTKVTQNPRGVGRVLLTKRG